MRPRRAPFCVMIQCVERNLAQEHSGDGLSLGSCFISSLSWTPCRGGFRWWCGDRRRGRAAVAPGGSPARSDGGGGAATGRSATAGQASPFRGGHMVRQRAFGIAQGCEDLNDHADLRHDPGLQTTGGTRQRRSTRFWWRAFPPVSEELLSRLRRNRSCWTGTRPTMRCPEIGRGHQEGRVFHGCQTVPASFPCTCQVVTNLAGDDRTLHEELSCDRGERENRIREQHLHLFADRTSCHRWSPNPFRLHPARRDPPARPQGHPDGPCPVRHPPS